MKPVRYIYWQDGKHWLVYIEGYPEYVTQGTTLDGMHDHLIGLNAEKSNLFNPRISQPLAGQN